MYVSDLEAMLLAWPWMLLPSDESEQLQQLMKDDFRAFWKSVRAPMHHILEPVATSPVYETEAPSLPTTGGSPIDTCSHSGTAICSHQCF